MSTFVLTGADTLTLNNNTFGDLADGEIIKITFPNELFTVETGKNGNSIFAQNYSGLQCEMELRLLPANKDDTFLNSLRTNHINNWPVVTLLSGQYVKSLGDGNSGSKSRIYNVSGGIFKNLDDASSMTKGEVEQGIVVYKLKFSNVSISIT